MTLLAGRITKIGSVSGAQPQGRVWIIQNEGTPTEVESTNLQAIQVDTSAGSARWDLVINAFLQSRSVEVDVLNTAGTAGNPYVADKVRITA